MHMVTDIWPERSLVGTYITINSWDKSLNKNFYYLLEIFKKKHATFETNKHLKIICILFHSSLDSYVLSFPFSRPFQPPLLLLLIPLIFVDHKSIIIKRGKVIRETPTARHAIAIIMIFLFKCDEEQHGATRSGRVYVLWWGPLCLSVWLDSLLLRSRMHAVIVINDPFMFIGFQFQAQYSLVKFNLALTPSPRGHRRHRADRAFHFQHNWMNNWMNVNLIKPILFFPSVLV